MMWWGNGGGWLLGGLMMLLFWAVVIGLVAWAIWALTRRQSGRADYPISRPVSQDDSALQIAKERYARGEISREQYDEIRQTLGA